MLMPTNKTLPFYIDKICQATSFFAHQTFLCFRIYFWRHFSHSLRIAVSMCDLWTYRVLKTLLGVHKVKTAFIIMLRCYYWSFSLC